MNHEDDDLSRADERYWVCSAGHEVTAFTPQDAEATHDDLYPDCRADLAEASGW